MIVGKNTTVHAPSTKFDCGPDITDIDFCRRGDLRSEPFANLQVIVHTPAVQG